MQLIPIYIRCLQEHSGRGLLKYFLVVQEKEMKQKYNQNQLIHEQQMEDVQLNNFYFLFVLQIILSQNRLSYFVFYLSYNAMLW